MEEGIKLSLKQAMYIISLFFVNLNPVTKKWLELIKKIEREKPNKIKWAGDGFFVIPLGAGRRHAKKCLGIYASLVSKRVLLVIYNKKNGEIEADPRDVFLFILKKSEKHSATQYEYILSIVRDMAK